MGRKVRMYNIVDISTGDCRDTTLKEIAEELQLSNVNFEAIFNSPRFKAKYRVNFDFTVSDNSDEDDFWSEG